VISEVVKDQIVAKRKYSMRTRSLILLVLLVTLSGCIVTYRDFSNATLESLPKDREPKPLYYHVEPIITLVNADIIEKKKASSRLVAGIVMAVMPSWYALHPQIDAVGQPGYHNVLPYYAGEGGTTVVYTLYRDGQLTQTYRYPITKKGAGWIVLLPFAWLNFFTNDLKDAVHEATLQFLIDAQRDGNL